jgi:hypothetical protein
MLWFVTALMGIFRAPQGIMKVGVGLALFYLLIGFLAMLDWDGVLKSYQIAYWRRKLQRKHKQEIKNARRKN